KEKEETLDGQAVDLLTVEVPKLPPAVQREYQSLLGPDWNKLRMVVQGKKVVGLFGSDVETLRETLKNIRGGDKGLAEHKTVQTGLARLAPERKLELHVSLLNYLPFNAAPTDKLPAPQAVSTLSSVALTIETDRIQLDLQVPKEDVLWLVKALRL